MADLHHRGDQSPPFQACISDAAQRGRFLMSRLIEQARKTMPVRADQATNRLERDLQHDALRLLLKHRNALEEAFPHALLECIGQLVDGGQGERSAGDLSFGALELMGDEQMQERVEMVRAEVVKFDADIVVKPFSSLLMHFAETDHAVPPATLDIVTRTLSPNKLAEIHVYPGVDHGFSNDARGLFAAPDFKNAAITLDDADRDARITLFNPRQNLYPRLVSER